MNQTKHCWQNYVDYHKCITAKGEDFAPCRQVRARIYEPMRLDVQRMTASGVDEYNSSGWPTDHCALQGGISDGMSSEVRIRASLFWCRAGI